MNNLDNIENLVSLLLNTGRYQYKRRFSRFNSEEKQRYHEIVDFLKIMQSDDINHNLLSKLLKYQLNNGEGCGKSINMLVVHDEFSKFVEIDRINEYRRVYSKFMRKSCLNCSHSKVCKKKDILNETRKRLESIELMGVCSFIDLAKNCKNYSIME